jgi:hypothetical protein
MPEEQEDKGTLDVSALMERLGLLEKSLDKKIDAVDKRFKQQLEKVTKVQPTPEPTDVPVTSEETKPEGSKLPPEFNQALKTVKALTAKLEEKEKAIESERVARLESERKSAIKDAMSGIQFRDKLHSDLFYKAVNGDIVRNEDGELVAKTDAGDLPVKDYITEMAGNMDGFLAPKGAGGTGATVGGKATKNVVSMDDLKPGMSKETEALAFKQIADAFRK